MAWNAIITDLTVGNVEKINKDNFGLELKKIEEKTLVKYVDEDETKNFIVYFTNTNHEYIIDKNGNILTQMENIIELEDGEDEEFDEKQVLSYNVALSKRLKNVKDTTKLYDLSGNENNADLNSINLDSSEKSIEFNGSSSYADLNLKSMLDFPLTIEMEISTKKKQNQVFYIDTNSKTAFGYYNGYFICTANTGSLKTFETPSDFFDGNKKHIVVMYKSLEDYEVFINGDKCSISSRTDYWSSNNASYIGKRSSSYGSYNFNGNLYSFKIYNRLLDETEYTGTNNKNNIVLEYIIENDNSFDIRNEQEINELADLINDNNAKCNNVVLNNEQNGIIFNGTSSYLELNLKSQKEFPVTIEMTISCSETLSSAVIYADPVSKTSFGCYNGHFVCIVNSNTKANTFTIPNNFFDGMLKHIVIEYNDLFNVNVYINGEQCTKQSNTDNWNWNSSSTKAYIGRRESGTYFKGTLYNFSIYNSLIPEDKILEKYHSLDI